MPISEVETKSRKIEPQMAQIAQMTQMAQMAQIKKLCDFKKVAAVRNCGNHSAIFSSAMSLQ